MSAHAANLVFGECDMTNLSEIQTGNLHSVEIYKHTLSHKLATHQEPGKVSEGCQIKNLNVGPEDCSSEKPFSIDVAPRIPFPE